MTEEHLRRYYQPMKTLQSSQKQTSPTSYMASPRSSPNSQRKDKLSWLDLAELAPEGKQALHKVKNGWDGVLGKTGGVVYGEEVKVKKNTISTKELLHRIHG